MASFPTRLGWVIGGIVGLSARIAMMLTLFCGALFLLIVAGGIAIKAALAVLGVIA